MQQELKTFFDKNPEATEAHVALGYICLTEDEANAKLAGVSGHAVTTFTRDQACVEISEFIDPKQVKADEERNKQLTQFRKLSPEKKIRGISELEKTIARKEASFRSESDQQKAEQSIAFLKTLLSAMKAVVDDEKEKQQ